MPTYTHWSGVLFNIYKPSAKAALCGSSEYKGRRIQVAPEWAHFVAERELLIGKPLFGKWPFEGHPTWTLDDKHSIKLQNDPQYRFGVITDSYIDDYGDFCISGSLSELAIEHFNSNPISRAYSNAGCLGMSFDSDGLSTVGRETTSEILYLKKVPFIGATIVQKARAAFRFDTDFRLEA